MMSDTSLEELHEFAQRLGLKRSWFQQGSAPHYDLSKTKRRKAVELGATELFIRGDRAARREWQRVYRAAKNITEQGR